MNPPLFTVIVPTYNRPEYLLQAIDSVVQQAWQDWELIVIDDGSEPPVADLVNTIDDRRVSYTYQSNRGLGATRQRGVELAKGTFVCYLDNDDYYLPHHLYTMATAYLEAGGAEKLYKVGMLSHNQRGELSKGALFEEGLPALSQHWSAPVGTFAYAIPRRVALIEPSINYFLSEDFNWLGRLMLHLPVQQIPQYTVVFRVHNTNRTNVLSKKSDLHDRIKAVSDLYKHGEMRTLVSKNLYRQMLVHQCLHWSRQCFRKRAHRDGWYGIRRAAAYFTPASSRDFLYTVFTALRNVL